MTNPLNGYKKRGFSLQFKNKLLILRMIIQSIGEWL